MEIGGQGGTGGQGGIADRFWRLAEALPIGLLHVDSNREVLYSNRRLHSILGVEPTSQLDDQLATVIDDDLPSVRAAFDRALAGSADGDIEFRVLVRNGEQGQLRHCTLNLRAVEDEEGAGAIACIADVSDRLKENEQLRLLATLDPLTRCYNRLSTFEALEREVARTSRDGPPAVIFVDLDDFKGLNDKHGHQAGDEFLRVVGSRLKASVRAHDVVGRFGGDEFVVVCPGMSSAEQAMGAAQRLSQELDDPVQLGKVSHHCMASMGVAWTNHPDVSAPDLIAKADLAMYESKRRGDGKPVMSFPKARDD